MNSITKLINRIEDYRSTNKNPCKSYATEASAEKVALKVAREIAYYYSGKNDDSELPSYLVFFNPAWGRWCVAFNIMNLLNRYGGYVGFASNKGFFTYCE